MMLEQNGHHFSNDFEFDFTEGCAKGVNMEKSKSVG